MKPQLKNQKTDLTRTQGAVLVALLLIVLLILGIIASLLLGLNFDNKLLADCVWTGTAQAWLDKNGDGVRNEGELPISNIPFFVDDALNDLAKFGPVSSNLQGEAHFGLFLAGCPDVAFTVYPELPAGYRLTTSARIPVEDRSNRNLFPFGFAYLPGVPPATPRPSPHLACIAYPLGGKHQYGRVSQLTVAPDGTVWGATLKGVFQFDPANRRWKSYTEENGLPSTSIKSLSMGPNGWLWSGTSGGIASFDGAAWITHRQRDDSSLGSEFIAAVTAENIWLTSAAEVSRLDPVTDKVITYPFKGEWHTDHIQFAVTTPDGALWAAHRDFVAKLIPPAKPSLSPQWIIYRIPDEFTHGRTLDLVGFSVSSDGALWLAGTTSKNTGVIRFSPTTKSWTAYNSVTTKGAILGEQILSFAVAPDDSIWLATLWNGVIQLTPARDSGAHHARVVYHIEKLLAESEIFAISFAPDGAVWFGSIDSIIQCTEDG